MKCHGVNNLEKDNTVGKKNWSLECSERKESQGDKSGAQAAADLEHTPTWEAQCLGLSFSSLSSSVSSSSSGSCSPGGGSATSRGKMAIRMGFSSFCFKTVYKIKKS